jgi:hypothetical protein
MKGEFLPRYLQCRHWGMNLTYTVENYFHKKLKEYYKESEFLQGELSLLEGA